MTRTREGHHPVQNRRLSLFGIVKLGRRLGRSLGFAKRHMTSFPSCRSSVLRFRSQRTREPESDRWLCRTQVDCRCSAGMVG
ncbi:hypothetical protein RSAG8_08127, partial [Rhizoctonia solani AG-8 WAC10335]